MINVLLIEDSAVFVLGLKLALSGNPFAAYATFELAEEKTA